MTFSDLNLSSDLLFLVLCLETGEQLLLICEKKCTLQYI